MNFPTGMTGSQAWPGTMMPGNEFLGMAIPVQRPEPRDDPGADLQNAVMELGQAQMDYAKAAAYYFGTQPEFFASLRLRIAMGATGVIFNFNFAKLPVDAVGERLEIAGISCADQGALDIIREQWHFNQLDLYGPDIMLNTCKFGDAYVFVWPNPGGDMTGNGIPDVDIFYCSPRIMRLFYDDENEHVKSYGVKKWEDSATGYTFANLYYADRVEKYMMAPEPVATSGAKPRWQKRLDPEDGDEWPIPNPFGEIPIFHFRNGFPYGRPEHVDAYGPQDAIHKLVISHMACVTSDTPVLCSDLTWKPAGELHVGSELVGFDEEATSSGGRKFRPTMVKEFKRGPDECFEIRTSRGIVTCTANHVWPVVWENQTNVRWVRTDRLMTELARGRRVQLLWLAEPWEVDDTRDGGWLQGIIDGEGTLTAKTGSEGSWRLSIPQNPGPVWDRMIKVLGEKGYSVRTYLREDYTSTKMTTNTAVFSTFDQILRALGSLRPTRFEDRSEDVWTSTKFAAKRVWINEIVSVGIREVVSLETGTATYVAGGFLTHNSVDYNAFPQRWAIMDEHYDTSEASFGDEGDYAFSIDTGATLDTGVDPRSQLTADPASLWFMKGIKQYGQFDAADPSSFLTPFTQYIHAMAVVTQTPMHFLDPIVSNVSGESLRVVEAPFAKKVRKRQLSFGATWRDLFRFVLKVVSHNANVPVRVNWVPAATVNDLQTLQGQLIKAQLGVPPRQLLEEQGYTPEQLDTWGITIATPPGLPPTMPTEDDESDASGSEEE